MAYIRKSGRGWQAVIRKKNHPHVYKTFFNKGDASRYAQESEIKIEKGLFDDMTEAHQTILRDILARYRDEITPNKKGAKQETYKINKLMRNKIAKYPFKHATRSKKHWLRAIIIVALETGARRGELFKLCRDDVDLNKSTALLRDTKNGADRNIGLSPKAIETLKGLAVSFDGRYFPTQSESFKFYWKQLQKWSGVMHNFHLLRHEWATRMFEKGWDISLVATQGGWRDWKTLKRYTAISSEHLAKKFREQS